MEGGEAAGKHHVHDFYLAILCRYIVNKFNENTCAPFIAIYRSLNGAVHVHTVHTSAA